MHVEMKKAAAVPWLAAFAWAVLAPSSLGAAQEETQPRRDKEKSGKSNSFFQSDRVDFWSDGKTAEKKATVETTKESLESIWAEPIRTPDGRFTTHVPPKKVIAFLENPTRETARDYLAWQEERMRKLKAAVDVLRELQEEKRGSQPKTHAVDDPEPSSLAGEILYFKKDQCPWCAEEDKALAALVKSAPGIKVRTVRPGEAPELWKEFGVTAVPTLVLFGSGGKETSKTVVRGYLPSDQLAQAFSEVNRDRK